MKKILIFLMGCIFSSLCFAQTTTQPLTVALDWSEKPTQAPLFIAEQQGFFKAQGLNVKFINLLHPALAPKMVAAQKADLALAHGPDFIEQVDHGLPIVRIGTLIDKPLNCIVALKESGIETLADLKGKTIGTNENNLSTSMVTFMLEHQGFSPKEIKLSPLSGNPLSALLTHKVAAITGTLRNLDVPKLEASGHQLVVFFPEEHGAPNYSEWVFVANMAHAHDPRFPRFLTALKEAVKYLDEHPQQAWQQFSKRYPHFNTALNKESWFATLPYFAENPSEFNHEEWLRFSMFMQKNKLISKAQPVSRYTVSLG